MSTTAKVFMNGRSQAIRLPKEFRVSGEKVSLTRVPGGILISESDPWEGFEEGSRELEEGFFKAMDARDRATPQKRDPSLATTSLFPSTLA
jgi:antitoxin VapB